jgi:hypothetical protein
MERREFAGFLGAAIAGLASGAQGAAQEKAGGEEKVAKHVCKGLNECRGQGQCKHGCGNHGCAGKNDCKGQGGCAARAAQHACKGKNACKSIGGCASGNKGCAGRNSCKGKGGCEVPLKVEHAQARERASERNRSR